MKGERGRSGGWFKIFVGVGGWKFVDFLRCGIERELDWGWGVVVGRSRNVGLG